MLGLANKARTIELFELAALGSIKAALILIRKLYDDGADAIIMMKDLLDVCHEVSRAKVLGAEALSDMASDQAGLLQEISKKLTVGQLTRIWQILIKSYDEVRVAPLPIAAAEMVLLKLSTAGLLPPPELATKIIKEMSTQSTAKGKIDQSLASGNSVNAGHPNHHSATERVLNTGAVKEISTLKNTMLALNTLEEIVEALPDSDIILKSDIKRYVKPIKVKQGMILYQPSEGAPQDLSGSIVTALKNLTGDLWVVSPEMDGGGSTLKDLEKLSQIAQDEKDKSHPIFMHSLIKEAKLIKIYNSKDEPVRNNVIKGNFGEQE
jgi:DNA polymerase-3 subunit gamma/tau